MTIERDFYIRGLAKAAKRLMLIEVPYKRFSRPFPNDVIYDIYSVFDFITK